MDRISRCLVLFSMFGAVALQAFLGRRLWAPLPELTALMFLLGLALGSLSPQFGLGLVLAAGYVIPAVFGLTIGSFWYGYMPIWFAAALGVACSRSTTAGWAFPARWKAPLAFWALVLALSWPIILLRETDFRLGMLEILNVPNTHIGVPPSIAAVGVLDGALIGGVGLLWMDALFRFFGRAPVADFNRRLLAPVVVTVVLACLVATYQGFVDVTVLNRTHFGLESRAVGTMSDANAFGALAGMWTAGLAAFALSRFSQWRLVVAALGSALALTAAWMSGSRTALLTGTTGLALVIVSVFLAASRRMRLWLSAAMVASAVLLLVGVMAFDPVGVGPLGRASSQIPDLRTEGVFAVLKELFWDRNNHGAAAVMMIREHPLVGVGVGAFNLLVVDYCRILGGWVVFDNAQNWFRHQLAELGVVGSVGWIVWSGLFAMTLLRSRGIGTLRVPAAGVKGALLGLTAASLLGMPAQNAVVTFTFWTFAFWYLALAVPIERQAGPVWPWGTTAAWAIVTLLGVSHAAGTLWTGEGNLRPANRAARFGWNYTYGFYAAEHGPDGQDFRWTDRQGVAVVDASGSVLRLTAWVYHPDAARRPVHVQIWVNSELAMDVHLQDSNPLTQDVAVPPEAERVVVRTRVDRVWRPSDYGSDDSRELGVAVANLKFVGSSEPLSRSIGADESQNLERLDLALR